jgi:hypothetical protein
MNTDRCDAVYFYGWFRTIWNNEADGVEESLLKFAVKIVMTSEAPPPKHIPAIWSGPPLYCGESSTESKPL